MIYCQTFNKEVIAVHPMDDVNNTQFVELVKYGDETVFSVWVYDGTEEWMWEFDMSNPSNYERVKLNIFDAIFGCDTMEELVKELDGIFHEGFEDILIEEDECNCCENCDGCKFDN